VHHPTRDGTSAKSQLSGEILVEIVRRSGATVFASPVQLVGPFPSGAPAIFIDQVAKLVQAAASSAASGTTISAG